MTRREPVIWLDREDSLAGLNSSGVERVCQAIALELASRSGAVARFCRVSRSSGFIEALAPPSLSVASGHSRAASLSRVLRRAARMLHAGATAPARDQLLGTRLEGLFAELVRPGDLLLSIGASWNNPLYGAAVRRAVERYGLRFGVLLHDIIPLTHPELSATREHVAAFRAWLAEMAASSAVIFTQSHYNRAELARLAEADGWILPPVIVAPFGVGLPRSSQGSRPGGANFAQPFVLCVSRIEPRKNHRLLLRVWRRLSDTHGRDAMPTLALAGPVGWGAREVIDEVAALRRRGDKVVLRSGLSDEGLSEAYGRCMFTVFPSLVEGWGLPVAESLAHGRFCVCSSGGASPEAGGRFAEYFEPEDEAAAFAAIERAIFDPSYLKRRTLAIEREYRPPDWGECVDAMVAAGRNAPAAAWQAG
jgi:glycosyltransferase involved in cell wall biosynthesis